MKILVTGATGYIGGRLIPRLLQAGHNVRVVVRDQRRVRDRVWASQTEIFEEDLAHPHDLLGPCEGMEAAYYLVHSMMSRKDFEKADRAAAEAFALACRQAGTRIIYLGGLQPEASSRAPSRHLASRAEVGRILAEHAPTLEFRAGPVIGSGSASFEMVRYLTERLPVMVAPRWIMNEVQPIAIRDVLSYLLAALEKPLTGICDIGADRLTFCSMMHVFADVRGYRRIIIPLPVLAPSLAARWVGLVTPIPNTLAVPLVQGLVNPLLANVTRARQEFPEINPIPYRQAVELALGKIERDDVETRWSGALGAAATYEVVDAEGLIREVRTRLIDCEPEALFAAFTSLGGRRGWLVWNWAWRIRGWIDKFFGGPGLRRGRRHPTRLYVGEALDFWRVEAIEQPRLLRLRAEMKVPGRAWLQFEAVPEGAGSRLVQTAMFFPHGFFGALYWYGLYPIHRIIFSALVKAVGKLALENQSINRRDKSS